MTRRRRVLLLASIPAAAAVLTACGSQGVHVGKSQSAYVKQGAQLFAARCSGCHTLAAAGTQGSATGIKNRERTDGPNFNQRKETVSGVLYAIRNGGFSGAIMPQNVVVGQDAHDVAMFVAQYAGQQLKKSTPSSGGTGSP